MNQTIEVDAAAGALIAGRRVAIAPVPGGALRVGGPDGPVLRPISFGERRRATRPAGDSGPVDRQTVVRAVTAAALVPEPAGRVHSADGLSAEARALALWLAGAGDVAPGFDTAASSVATRIGWAADQIDGADAASIDRLAMNLALDLDLALAMALDHAEPAALSIPSDDDGWHRIVFGEPKPESEPVPEAAPGPAPAEDGTSGSTGDLEELVGALADDLRRRAEPEPSTPAGPIRMDAPSPVPVRNGPTPSTIGGAHPAAAGSFHSAVPAHPATTDRTDGHPDRAFVTTIPTSQVSLVPDPAAVPRPALPLAPQIGLRDRRARHAAAPATQLGPDRLTADPQRTEEHSADGQSAQATTPGRPPPTVPPALGPTPLRTATDTRRRGLAALPEQPLPLSFAPLERLSPPQDPASQPIAPRAIAQPSAPIRIDLGAIADALATALSDEADLRGLRP